MCFNAQFKGWSRSISIVNNNIGSSSILKRKLIDLPTQPGVYLYRDEFGCILYIGKAKNLRNRVKSYFRSKQTDDKTTRLVSCIWDLEFIVCETELEALILENNMIREHRPPYNILVKDANSYPYIKLTWTDDYPRAYVTHELDRDGSFYYGPFFPVSVANRMLELVYRFFQIRNCDININKQRNSKACLKYQIHMCTAPCIAAVTKEEYRRQAHGAKLFLEGRRSELKKMLKVAMWNAARNDAFELAATYRDTLSRLDSWFSRQRAASLDRKNVDVYGSAIMGSCICVHRLIIRNGLMLGRIEHLIRDAGFSNEVIIAEILKQVYSKEEVPEEVLVDREPEDLVLLQEWLGVVRGSRTAIRIPKKGDKAGLLAMAQKNAYLALERKFEKNDLNKEVLDDLSHFLDLTRTPQWIDCFDVSHSCGCDVVASCVVFIHGMPDLKQYRRFKISSEQNNDFANMFEVVRRRYKRLKGENLGFPDLILIDGGLGQLHAVEAALMSLGLEMLDLISIAKKEELVFKSGSNMPLPMPKNSNALYLLQRIRDEAHRFAVGYHRRLRARNLLRSDLTQINGIGLVTARSLLKSYGSVKAIRDASHIDLKEKFGLSIANKITRWIDN